MRKRKKLLLFLITVLVLIATAVALCACGEEENDGTMFTVTLKSGYNDDSTSVQVAYGANYALPENPFTRAGYDFTGWTKEGSSFLLSPGAVSPIYVDTVYVANWQKSDSETPQEPEDPDDPGDPEVPERVTLTLFAGFGSEKQSITLDKGEEYVLPENPFVREGYIFDGWSYGGETLAPGEKITVDASVTVTALWREMTYTVTFISDDEPVSVMTDKKKGEFVNAPAAPDKTGYDFVGWQSVDASGAPLGEPVAAGSAINVTGDMTFEAVWTIKTYEITFIVRRDSQTVSVNYGDVPVCPIDVPESVNVDYMTTAWLVGWDNEIVAATEDFTYTAVYRNAARLYPVVFEQNGYIHYIVDGERVEEMSVEYGQTVIFTVEREPGVITDDMVVSANGKELQAEDGIYTLGWSSNSVVGVSGWELAEYDIGIKATNAVYEIIVKPETLVYGSEVSFKAKGAEGYSSAVPEVSYGAETLSPVSGQPDEDGWYVYEFEAKYSYDVTIAGIADPEEPSQDAIPITYVDFYGNRYTVEWTEGMGYVGDNTNVPLAAKQISYLGTQAFRTNSDFTSDGMTTIYAYTTEPLAEYNMVGSEAEFQEILSEIIANPVYPQKGDENVYYILYYPRTNGTKVEFTAPKDATDIGFMVEGENVWHTSVDADDVSEFGHVNYIILCEDGSLTTFSFKTGDKLIIGITLPEGAVAPDLYNIYDESKTPVSATKEAPEGVEASDANVFYYYIDVTSRNMELYFVDEELYPYTATFETLSNSQYTIYTSRNPGTEFPNRSALLQEGQTLTFRIKASASIYLDPSIIGTYDSASGMWNLNDSVKQSLIKVDGTYGEIIVEGKGTSTAITEFVVSVTDVCSDIRIYDVTLPVNIFNVPIQIDQRYDYYVNGEIVEGAAGEIVQVQVPNGTDIEIRLKEGSNACFVELSGAPDKVKVTWKYNSNLTGQPATASLTSGRIDNGNRVIFTLNLNDMFINMMGYGNFITTEPFAFNNIDVVYFTEHVADKCASSHDVTGVSVISAGEYVSVGGKFEITISAPIGTMAVLNLERAYMLSDGFKKIYTDNDVISGENVLYTFSVDIDCDVRWFISTETAVYTLKFYYGENIFTTEAAYGTPLSEIRLPTEFIGVNEARQETYFLIIGWNDASDTEVTYIDGRSEVLTAVVTETEYTAKFTAENGDVTYYETLAAALEADTGAGTIDLMYGRTDTSLSTGSYIVGQGVSVRLPYAVGGYDRAYGVTGAEGNSPAVFFADTSLGKTSVVIAEGATLEVYGSVSVGGIVGYPQSAYPYQGQTAGAYAVLQLDGVMNVNEGGVLKVNGYVEGAGSLELKAGASSYLPFVVKDYRGGTNSSNVYSEGYAPFNIFEMPNVLVSYKINYGATEYAYAMLYAMEMFNEVTVEVIGDEGMIRLGDSADGYVLKNTRRIRNPRYTGSNSSVEPEYEYRTELDIYGGGSDGVMSMNLLGVVTITTKDVNLGIPYTYERITLHDGEYTLYNKYKILPGATMEVASDAVMNIVEAIVDGETYRSSLIVYEAGFKEESSQLTNRAQLTYPVQPNGTDEAGVLKVSGKLVIRGSLAGAITGGAEGARIEVRTMQSQLTLTAKEAVHLANNEFDVTYEKTLTAKAGETVLEANAAYLFTDGEWIRA